MPAFGRPDGVFGMRLERAEAPRRLFKQGARLRMLIQRRMGLRQGQRNGFRPEVGALLADVQQQLLRGLRLIVGQPRLGCAQTDFGVRRKGALQAGLVVFGCRAGLIGIEQALR